MQKKYFVILLIILVIFYYLKYFSQVNHFINNTSKDTSCGSINKFNYVNNNKFNKNKIINRILFKLPKNVTKINKFYWLKESANNVAPERNKYVNYSTGSTNKITSIYKNIDMKTKLNSILKTNQLIYEDKNLFNILANSYSKESLKKFITKSNYYDILARYIKFDNANILYKLLNNIEINIINDNINKYKITNVQVAKDIDDNKIILYGNSKAILSLIYTLNNYVIETKLLDLYDKIKPSIRKLNKNIFNNYNILTDAIKMYLRIGLFNRNIIIAEYKNIMIQDNISQHYYIINITNYTYDKINKLVYYLSNNINVFYLTILYNN